MLTFIIPTILFSFQIEKISEFSFSESYVFSHNLIKFYEDKLYINNFRSFQQYSFNNNSLSLELDVNISGLLYNLDVKDNKAIVFSLFNDSEPSLYSIDFGDLNNPILDYQLNYLGSHLFFIDSSFVFVNELHLSSLEFQIHVYDLQTFEEITSFWHEDSGMLKVSDNIGLMFGDNILKLYDITDPLNIVHFASGPSNFQVTNWNAQLVQDTFLFCGDTNSLHIYDISFPYDWELLSDTIEPGTHFAVTNNFLCVIEGCLIRLYDISNLSNPILTDSDERLSVDPFYGIVSNDNYLFLCTKAGYILVYNIENGILELVETEYNYGWLYAGCYLHDNHLYISTALKGICRWDLSDVFSPELSENYFDEYVGVILRGDEDDMIQFCWDKDLGIQTNLACHIEEDNTLTELATLSSDEFAGWMSYRHGVGYLNLVYEVLYKYQVNEDNEFEVVGTLNMPSGVLAGQIFFQSDSVAYITPPGQLLVVNNIHTDDQMELVAQLNVQTGGAETAEFYENYFFLSEEGNNCTCSIFDISNPLDPVLLYQIPDSGLLSIDEDNELLFIGNYSCSIYDLSTISTGVLPELFEFSNWSSCQEIIPFQRNGENYLIYLEDTSCSIYHYEYDPNQIADEVISIYPSLSNHPNPFNPSTEIRFQMSEVGESESAEVVIYNIKGQKVKTLPVTPSPSLTVSLTWDGTDRNNRRVSTGVYFYQLQVDGNPLASRKMMILK